MKKLIGWILRTYYSIYTPLYFKRKKRKADRLHKLTGRRYHVVPKTRTSLVVVDNSYIDKYNKAVKGKARKITIVDLIKMSWYSTSVEGITRKPKTL